MIPILDVDQFAMVRLTNDKTPEPLVILGLEQADLPTRRHIPGLLNNRSHSSLSSSDKIPSWIRQIIPLSFGEKCIGFWLLGKTNKNQTSPQTIDLINQYAEMTTLALMNIYQANNLRALYLADVERHEKENQNLAAELQDEVLASLSLVKGSLDPADTPPMVWKSYQGAVRSIRDMINHLRPAMYTHGLYNGLAALVNELNSLRLEELIVHLEIPDTDIRYQDDVELHIYRIIQHAIQNAIHHSRAASVHISGMMEPSLIEISVIDDGVGFSSWEVHDLSALISNHYFGLAGMFERARLIGARLVVESQPNQGCCVKVNWQPFQPDTIY